MNTNLPTKNRHIGTARMVLLLFGVILGLFFLGIWRCFHASSDLRILRNCMESAVQCDIHPRFSFNAGSILFGLVRSGSSFFTVPPEVTVGLQSIRGVETSICRWDQQPKIGDFNLVIDKVDKEMQKRGWERMITVVEEGMLVLVFNSINNQSPQDQRFCVAIFQGENLILASVRGNWDPLLAYASHAFKELLKTGQGELGHDDLPLVKKHISLSSN